MNFRPNWISNPQSTITDIIVYNNIDRNHLVEKFKDKGVDLDELLEGKLCIDAYIASVLSEVFNNSEEFWLRKQESYNTRLKELDQEWEQEWVNSLPINTLVEEGFISSKTDLYRKCLDFFEVKSIFEWKIKYLKRSNLAFRKSSQFDARQNVVIAWQRMGELRVKSVRVPEYNKTKFEFVLQNNIKKLTRKNSPAVFIPKLLELCHDCGVRVSIQKAPRNCKTYGVTMFVDENPLIILSFRYLSDDQFWFTFFHEAGHIILHEKMLINFEGEEIVENSELRINQELEANIFAEEVLIPFNLKKRLPLVNRNKRDIIHFAMEANISPGIVIGQLQHTNIIKKSYLNSYKRFFSREDIDLAFQAGIKMLTEK